MHLKSIEYQKKVLNPWIFRTGMFFRLPSVFFWGIIVRSLDEKQCKLTLPYSWRTQNPFKSIYFAALAGAAELSTGALCQLHLAGRSPHSMLVVHFQMEYLKKAASLITLSCYQGDDLKFFLDSLTAKGQTGTFKMLSTARDISGDIVAQAYLTWSFKLK